MISIEACEPFFEYMRKSVELDPGTMELIAAHTSEISFPPKQILLPEGGICNNIYFVVSGMARSYYTDVSGTTITWLFHFNNNKSGSKNLFALDYRAFLTSQPSIIAIETCNELNALVFTREAITYLIKKSLTYEIWMRKIK